MHILCRVSQVRCLLVSLNGCTVIALARPVRHRGCEPQLLPPRAPVYAQCAACLQERLRSAVDRWTPRYALAYVVCVSAQFRGTLRTGFTCERTRKTASRCVGAHRGRATPGFRCILSETRRLALLGQVNFGLSATKTSAQTIQFLAKYFSGAGASSCALAPTRWAWTTCWC